MKQLTSGAFVCTIARRGITLGGIVTPERPEMPDNHGKEPEAQTALSAQVFQILLSLLDEDLHGYALIQDIRRRTEGEVVLTASTLYAAAKRLLGAGWIEEVEHETPPPDHDARRRYYRITDRGR